MFLPDASQAALYIWLMKVHLWLAEEYIPWVSRVSTISLSFYEEEMKYFIFPITIILVWMI